MGVQEKFSLVLGVHTPKVYNLSYKIFYADCPVRNLCTKNLNLCRIHVCTRCVHVHSYAQGVHIHAHAHITYSLQGAETEAGGCV